MIPVDVNTGPMLKSGLSAYSLHIAVAIHLATLKFMSPLYGMVCVQCGGPIAFKIAFKILGGKYIQGTKRKGKEEGKGNIAAFTFESHEDSKRRRGGDGHGGVHSTFLPWQGTEKEEKQRRESKYQLSF
ncbi:hypothetical protein NC652_026653 [Populus alba x Populus x berolinensis]|nr:hypothetical protein NC652_026653 [Populus alba x Populus x berolinensis]